jgi:glycosyltransferase involved in cell wall biosynthesis
MRRLIRRCLGQAVLAIVLGDSLRSVFSGLVETNRIVVLPNGVPPPAGFIAAPEREGTARVLFLSNLSEAKGHLDVIEAAAIVASRLARVRFHLAGEWPGSAVEKAALAAVRARGLAGRVIFHRAVSGLRKWELLHEADVFVFPPRHLEGQPVVILEAMSHGLPVVSTPQGGIVDTVVAGETGLLVPAHDPVALANAIERLLEDEPLRMRMGRAGQARYAAKFTAAAFQSNLAGVMAGSRPEAPLGRVTSGTT